MTNPINADKGHTAGLTDITARPDLGEVRLSAVATVLTHLGEATNTPEPMDFATVAEAMAALNQWVESGFSPLAGRFVSLTVSIDTDFATRPHDAALAGKLAEALVAIGALEADYEAGKDYCDADWEGLAFERLTNARAALAEWEAGRGE